MYTWLTYEKMTKLLLLIFISMFFIPSSVQAVMPPAYSDNAKSSVIKAVAVVKTVKAEDDYWSIVLFDLERSFGEKTLEEFEGICPTGSYSPPEGMTGGNMYYRPHKGDRVLVTVDTESHVTSYTKISSELDSELNKNGLENIIFSMGHAMIRYSNYYSVKPKLQKNDVEEAKELLAKGQDQWGRKLYDEALKSLKEAVKLDASNKKTAKIFRSMQLQKKRIDKDQEARSILKELSNDNIPPERVKIDKPAIYLYPQKKQKIDVSLAINGSIVTSIPSYGKGWSVIVDTNGTIDNQYDYLFYENTLNTIELPQAGWIKKGSDLSEWFDVILPKLGLNKKEKKQFKEYWLKKLNKNSLYEIKLFSVEFLSKNMTLKIDPKPDTVIRVIFNFKRIKKQYELPSPVILIPKRVGFHVLEWGGRLEEVKK